MAKDIDLTALPDPKTADVRRRETASEVQKVTSILREAELQLERLRARRDKAREVLTTTMGESRNAAGTLDRNRHSLNSERQKASDLELQSKIDESRTAEADLLQAFLGANARYLEADPAAATERVRMAKTALTNLDSEIQHLEKSIEKLKGSLETIGKSGPGEQCAALEADLNNATVQYATFDRDAQALRLLYQTIADTERDANTQFLQPVVERVQPYLRRVLPGARVKFSADLTIEGLDRGQTTEPFDSLSVGAREQVSVLTRIAFADLLASQGMRSANHPGRCPRVLRQRQVQRYVAGIVHSGQTASDHHPDLPPRSLYEIGRPHDPLGGMFGEQERFSDGMTVAGLGK